MMEKNIIKFELYNKNYRSILDFYTTSRCILESMGASVCEYEGGEGSSSPPPHRTRIVMLILVVNPPISEECLS